MLPWRPSASSVCLSEGNFAALLGTAVVVTAAATYWCSLRRMRRCRSFSSKPTTATTIPAASPACDAAEIDSNCSYLCSSCGTEKYSSTPSEQVLKSTSSPYKMVILVRTDLNMVN